LIGRILERFANAFAIAAGLLLCVLALLVVVSVTGRASFLAPIPGDFEIVANGTAAVVFLCLPYCHLNRGNIMVDLFLARAPRPLPQWLDALWAAVYGALAFILGVRMIVGLRDTFVHGDTTIIVGMPIWWAYPFGVASFLLLAACCAYTALGDVKGEAA
jgi:TRAP-type C4-dicarboxylate transport system permease small subunit